MLAGCEAWLSMISMTDSPIIVIPRFNLVQVHLSISYSRFLYLTLILFDACIFSVNPFNETTSKSHIQSNSLTFIMYVSRSDKLQGFIDACHSFCTCKDMVVIVVGVRVQCSFHLNIRL